MNMDSPLLPADSDAIDIVVSVEGGDWPADAEDLATRAGRAALDAATAPKPSELSLVLADNALVHRLNREYRGQDKPTNVLSFPLTDGEEVDDDSEKLASATDVPVLLGDVILAFETVAAEARDQGKAFADHLSHLVIHGVLHLLGFDHMTDADAEIMERLEEQVLARLGIADPYASRSEEPDGLSPVPTIRTPVPTIRR